MHLTVPTGRMDLLVQQFKIRYAESPHPESLSFSKLIISFQAIETILEHYTDIFVDESEDS
jgi:hypothetical protein